MTESLFEADGERWVPTELARGPWSPEALHGGPPAALLARAIEAHEVDAPMQVVRLTVELLRPVPVAPLSLSVRMGPGGRKVQRVEASLHAGDREVCRAVGLRIRQAEIPLPTEFPPDPPPPGPDQGQSPVDRGDYPAFHNRGVEMRYVKGSFDELGPATVWMRLRVPVVPGEAPSGLMRAAATADFGNGVSAAVMFGEWSFVNPDLTVYLERPPVGEWVCLDAVTRPQPTGVAFAESVLFDEEGRVGRSIQSLVLEKL